MKHLVRTVVVLTLLLAAVPAAVQSQTSVVDGKRVYLVRPGDTLAGIAAKFLGAPGRWRELWKANPQVRKPGLIFPGDTLVLGDAAPEELAELGVREKAAAPAESAAAVTAEPTVIAPEEFMEGSREEALTGPILRPVPTVEGPEIPTSVYDRCGFITDRLPEASIIGSPDGKLALSTYDDLFIDRGDRDGVTVGEAFRVLRPVRPMFHPRTGAPLGWLVKVMGRIAVDCVGADTSTAKVILSYDTMREGDLLEPWSPPGPVPEDRSLGTRLTGPCVPGSEAPGPVILAVEENKLLVSEGDVVFLDRGLAGGLVPGTKLAVWRQGGRDRRGTFLVGEVQVLLAQTYTASALVTNSLHPLSPDDGLVIW